MSDDPLSFQVYLPERGNAFSQHKDGEISLRLSVPGQDRAALLQFLDALGVGGGDDSAKVLRLVVVKEAREQ